MTLKQNWVSRTVRSLKLGVAGIGLLVTAGGLTAGCLDRPVAPAAPRTSNVVVKTVTQSGVDKIDLLFMIDNSISMADKQVILAQAVPVLVNRLIDPVCVDAEGNPTGDNSSADTCTRGTPEFTAIKNIHIGVISSSLGNHGGADVCNPDPARTPNDGAQFMPSVRTGLYSYQNQGFLVWDPRTGMDRPAPDPHPGLTNHEQDVDDFVMDFATHVRAAGEVGCGYEASLEAWYRFLVDPEPIRDVANDGQFSVRQEINPIVLQQRAAFMRPDSLLAIVMLTDENDCSINDENGRQGWLVGTRRPMPRGSDACAQPGNPDVYKCCIPCVLLDVPGFQAPEGCSYNADVACTVGHSLPMIEDSSNLRCYQQTRRFGLDLLYPWQRYTQGLTQPRIRLRVPVNGSDEVTNPIFTPGADGTPARAKELVFLAGIIGVPWQDIATQDSLMGRGLKYLSARDMAAPKGTDGVAAFGTNRWDVILGDPDAARPPTDPFMIESIDERPAGAANPVPGVTATIAPSSATGMANPINGHEQNIVNRDDLQYACTFDLEPDVPCSMANTDSCDCNDVTERAYNRSLCEYPASGDGTQVYAKAYPGTRHLQVLKGFGDNAIVASICPKNVMSNGASDADYGYNPAVGAIINRLKEALVGTCLPRPLFPDEGSTEVPCKVVESFLPPTPGMCGPCNLPGRTELEKQTIRVAVEEELKAGALCGGQSGVKCSAYCMCEIQQFTGADLNTCQNAPTDPGGLAGYCYVDRTSMAADELLKNCPPTQQQSIRFLGAEVPRKSATAFIACLGGSGEVDAGM